jgi:hypothetical protein
MMVDGLSQKPGDYLDEPGGGRDRGLRSLRPRSRDRQARAANAGALGFEQPLV